MACKCNVVKVVGCFSLGYPKFRSRIKTSEK